MITQINEREKAIMINAIIKTSENPSVDSVMKDLRLIDDLLRIQKSRILFMPTRTKSGKLRRDASLLQVMEKRIEQDI